MSSVICFNLDQFKILSSRNGLNVNVQVYVIPRLVYRLYLSKYVYISKY